MKKSQKILGSIVLFTVIAGAFATYFYKNKKSAVYTYSMKTVPEQKSEPLFGTLLLTALPTSKNMSFGTLCLDHVQNVKKVDLFMPDMGHGSAPPIVSQTKIPDQLSDKEKGNTDFGCLKIDSMQLFMPGLWQVRVFDDHGVVGIFDLDLAN